MKFKIIKSVLYGLLVLFTLGFLLLLTPRVLASLYPQKTPIGYHFLPISYFAIKVGLEELVNENPDVPENIEEIKNIEYKSINGKSLQLDFCKPKDSQGKAPLVVFIHGGGWYKGNRTDLKYFLVDFAKLGYMTAAVSYRLVKDGTYPACVEDITDAVNWFYNHGDEYGYDPDRITLVGVSAGAHLAMLVAYGWKNKKMKNDSTGYLESSHQVKAVVNIVGPVDLTTEFNRHRPEGLSFIGKYEEVPQLYMEASPIQYVDKNSPPTLIIQGTSDELVFNCQADMLRAKLDSVGVPYADYRLPLWHHNFFEVERVYNFCLPKMNEFFQEYLK